MAIVGGNLKESYETLCCLGNTNADCNRRRNFIEFALGYDPEVADETVLCNGLNLKCICSGVLYESIARIGGNMHKPRQCRELGFPIGDRDDNSQGKPPKAINTYHDSRSPFADFSRDRRIKVYQPDFTPPSLFADWP